MRHEFFEWDEGKAAANLRKHNVSFGAAARALRDLFAGRFHIEEYDEKHSTEFEDRWIITGSLPDRRQVVLVIVWTLRVDRFGRRVTRIISARTASPTERRDYEKETSEN